jgi:hypothetical protein
MERFYPPSPAGESWRLVVDHIEMLYLPFRNLPASVGDDDEDLFDHYLQEILSLF